MTEKLKFAIIGFGNIGRRHAQHIINNIDTELVAICDIKDGVEDDMPEGVQFYNDLQKMLRTVDINVLCICTPNYLHETHAMAGLKSGMHVIVEKPMAMSVAECDRMITAAEHANRTIFAVKQNRYNEPVQAVKKLIDEKQLGDLYMLQVNCFWNRSDHYYSESNWRGKKEKDGGCLFTQFSHFVDILYYLNGTVTNVEGWVHNFAHKHNTEVEDTGSFVLKGANGTIINFNFTTCSYEQNMEGSITIFAEKGTIKIGGQYLNTIEYQQLKDIKIPDINITAKANEYGKYQGSMSNHDKLIQNVVDVLQKQDNITTTAEDGRAVVHIIEQMYTAAVNI